MKINEVREWSTINDPKKIKIKYAYFTGKVRY